MTIHQENTANKLRPKLFKEIFGQEFIVHTICSSIEQNIIAPAYLFSGPRGVGKTSIARLIALAVNRPEKSSIDELSYPGSEDIRLGKSLDVIEIDGASYTSVEHVRNIREEILYAPIHFRYKVYIIDEVHMLSNSAFNALLKTIEEPPSYVIFIFATTELHKVPVTIRSRCQQYLFRLINITDISTQLEKLCKQEHIQAELPALLWIAKESQGSFRDAYTLFDQIKAFSDNTITIESIKTHLGLAGLDTLNQIFSSCAKGERKVVMEQLDFIFTHGVAVEQFVIEASEYMRNILFLKVGIQSSEVLGFASELFDQTVLDAFSIVQIERALVLLLECYRTLRYSVNTRYEVEVVFAQLCDLSLYVTPQQLVRQLAHIQSEGAIATDDAEDAEMIAPSQDEYASSLETSTLNTPTLSDKNQNVSDRPQDSIESKKEPKKQKRDEVMFQVWNEVVSIIRKKDETLALVLDSATIEYEKDRLSFVFFDEFSYNKYKNFEERIVNLVARIAKKPVALYVRHQNTPADTSEFKVPVYKGRDSHAQDHKHVKQEEHDTHAHDQNVKIQNTESETVSANVADHIRDVFGATNITP